jgi:putative ABC transport system permease protein
MARMFEAMLQDIRFGVRLMLRSPLSTVVIVLTLSLGIGATTAVFGIVQAVLLRPLPYHDPQRLVAIWDGHIREANLAKVFASLDDFTLWRDHATSFDKIGAVTWATGGRIVKGAGPATQALAIPSSVEIFDVLGVPAARGRTFTPDDLSRGCTVVLADRFWQNALHASPAIVGSGLTLDDQACTVVGVMPPQFEFYPKATDLWTLLADRDPQTRGGVGVFARLKPGVSVAVAQTELRSLHQATGVNDHRVTFAPTVYPLQSEFTWLSSRTLRQTLLVLLAAVGCVLIIACVNVANLLVGRSLDRQRELAVRSAIGGGRSRLLQQLLTESLLLAGLGGALGILLAVLATDAFRAVNPIELPPGTEIAIDGRVLAVAAMLTLSTAVLFGLTPAWRGSRVDLATVLRSVRAAGESRSRRLLGEALIIIEVACSVMLLVAAGLLVESMIRLSRTPLGFDPNGLLTMTVRLPKSDYAESHQRAQLYDRLGQIVATVPGVDDVAMARDLPATSGTNVLTVEGRPPVTLAPAVPDVGQDSVSVDYFQTLRIPVRAGRTFESGDREGSLPVAIVNDALVRKHFPNESPLGKRVKLGPDADRPWMTIVGVVGSVKGSNLYQEMAWAEAPTLYRPMHQAQPTEVSLIIRSDSQRSSIASTVRQRIAGLNPNVAVDDARMMTVRLSESLAYPRLRAVLLSGFAGLALLLAAMGLYGVQSQLVARRRQEIGVRVALGASRSTILRLVMGNVMWLTSVGLVIGLLIAAWLGRAIAAMAYGTRATDPTLVALASVCLLAATAVAAYVPTRRALLIEPVSVLRDD